MIITLIENNRNFLQILLSMVHRLIDCVHLFNDVEPLKSSIRMQATPVYSRIAVRSGQTGLLKMSLNITSRQKKILVLYPPPTHRVG